MKSFVTFTILLIVYFTVTSYRHPYHVGSVEMSYNKKTSTFEITGKFFIDDLENALSKESGQIIKFEANKINPKIQEILSGYCQKNMDLRVNNQKIPIRFLGYEIDKESVTIFLESQAVKQPRVVETSIKNLYNLFDDQMNIIHIIVDGHRKSNRLSYPNYYLKTVF